MGCSFIVLGFYSYDWYLNSHFTVIVHHLILLHILWRNIYISSFSIYGSYILCTLVYISNHIVWLTFYYFLPTFTALVPHTNAARDTLLCAFHTAKSESDKCHVVLFPFYNPFIPDILPSVLESYDVYLVCRFYH